jgi:hypothetical protein
MTNPNARAAIAVMIVLAVGAVSCSKNASPSADSNSLPVTQVAQPAPAADAGVAASPQGESTVVTPPAGAEWTIYCMTVPGIGHIERSKALRDQLVRSSGLRDWYVVHNETESTLYHGFYKSLDRSVKATREKIDAMTDAAGNRPFRNSLIVEVSAPDPDAPPRWNLAGAPPGMMWSLQVAAYADHPDRKKYAVDAVKGFRASGVQAFYFHGPSVSSVCVGVWPDAAVRGDMEPAFNDPDEQRSIEEIMARGPADVVVLPPGMPPVNKEMTVNNRRVRAVTPHLEAVDPTLLAAMKTYPHHYYNGVVEGAKSKTGVQPKPSFLVKVPRQPDKFFGSGGALAGSQKGDGPSRTGSRTAGSREEQAPRQQTPGYGRLRSLGEP